MEKTCDNDVSKEQGTTFKSFNRTQSSTAHFFSHDLLVCVLLNVAILCWRFLDFEQNNNYTQKVLFVYY